MLSRGKPLAHFCDVHPSPADEEIIPRSAFAPYVRRGDFEMREFVHRLKAPLPHAPHVRGVLHVLYAIAPESWRLDAYIAMLAEGEIAGWSERLERMQGTLLGYTDVENNAHIAHLLRSGNINKFSWLKQLAYARGVST